MSEGDKVHELFWQVEVSSDLGQFCDVEVLSPFVQPGPWEPVAARGAGATWVHP